MPRITTDYQFWSPSGPADCQKNFPLGFTVDYCELRRITGDYLGLLGTPRIASSDHQVVQRITRVVSPSGLPLITVDYDGLLRITRIPRIISSDHQSSFPLEITADYSRLRRINPVFSDYCDLLRITRIALDNLDYPGSPLRITKWFTGLPEMFAPRECRGLLRISLDYPGLFGHPGWAVRIIKWSSGLSELFPPWGYRGLLRLTPNYTGLLRIIRFTPIYFGLLRITRNTPDCQFGSPSGSTDYQSSFPFECQ